MPEPVALSHTSTEFEEEKNWSSKESRSGIFSMSEGDISLPVFFVKSTP
jgi:hypothetical protein